MWWILILLASLIAGFIYKFILRPYYKMSKYAKYKGVYKFKFIPIIGPFALLKTQLEQYGDCFYDSKRTFQIFPDARAIAFNLADRPALTILDPKLIQEYYQQKEDNYVKYQLTYKNKARIFGNGVAFAEGSEWKKRRVVTTALMNFDFFQIIMPKLRDTAQKVIDELDFNNGTAKFNALQLSSRIAGQSIVRCFFGTDLHNIKFNDQPISPAVGKFVSEVGNLDQQFLIFLFGVGILKLGLTQNHRRINRKIKQIRQFGRQIVEAKIKSAETDQEMNFIKYIKQKGYLDPKSEAYLTSQEILDQFFTFFVGGMDTTAHLLHMCFYYLTLYPEIQQNLRNQINTVEQNPDIGTINKLKQLDKFITETNRHYGFMSSFFPRQAIKQHTLGDIKIEKGTILTMGWLSNYYNEQYFENKTKFDPSRWNKPAEPYTFIPFSAGKRTCIGKNLALIEIKLVLIKLLRECRLKGDPNYQIRFVFRSLYQPQKPIIIQLEKLNK